MNSISPKSKSIPIVRQSKAGGPLQRAFDLCVRKTRHNIKLLADKPTTWAFDADGDYSKWKEDFFEIGNWTTSFFTGMALLAWRDTEDEYFLKQVLRLAPCYHDKVFTRHLDTHHDLGFLYSLYSVALYKLTKDKVYREVGLRAADVLCQRFNHSGNFIRAWGHMNTTEQDNMAIIDCLMNLPLLYWASLETGNNKYRDIAMKHADMTLKYFVRKDDSVYHAYRFDLRTGKPLGGDTYGGWAVESHWARGTAWAIYGFALSYGYTRDPKYLEASLRVAKKFITSLDEEVVPLWDFKLPPSGQRFIRDASAGAIAVCGFQELEKHNAASRTILETKTALLERLSSENYLNFDENCLAVLKNCQVGDGNGGQNAYTSWGDYYLMEALDRELNGGETWW